MRRSVPVIYLALNAACALAMLYAAHRVVVRRRGGRALLWLGGGVAVWSVAFLSIRFIHR